MKGKRRSYGRKNNNNRTNYFLVRRISLNQSLFNTNVIKPGFDANDYIEMLVESTLKRMRTRKKEKELVQYITEAEGSRENNLR